MVSRGCYCRMGMVRLLAWSPSERYLLKVNEKSVNESLRRMDRIRDMNTKEKRIVESVGNGGITRLDMM